MIVIENPFNRHRESSFTVTARSAGAAAVYSRAYTKPDCRAEDAPRDNMDERSWSQRPCVSQLVQKQRLQ